MARLRLDLQVRNSFVQIVTEEHGIVEELQNITVDVTKPFDSSKLQLTFRTDLSRPDSTEKGLIDVVVEAEADPKQPVNAKLKLDNVHLDKYRPLLAAFLEPDQIEAFSGILRADCTVTGVPTEKLNVDGVLSIDNPHFQGPLFSDMNIKSPRWEIRPKLSSTIPQGDELPTVDLSEFVVDLGFLTVNGQPSEAPAKAGDPQTLALAFAVDIAKLAEFGGPIPAELEVSKTDVKGSVKAPFRTDWGDKPVDAIVAALDFQAQVTSDRLEFAEQVLEQFGANLALKGGQLSLTTAPTSKFDGGALNLSLKTDLTNLEQPPVELEIGLNGANVAGKAVEALQYAVPLFAGLGDKAAVDLQSMLNLNLKLSGPGLPAKLAGGAEAEGEPAATETVLQWLNHWSGSGNLGLENGSFTPAAEFSQLLTLVGQNAKLPFKNIATDFVMKNGAVETGLMKLSAAGREIGFQGSTTLSGDLDYTFDARSLLAGHKDGAKILAFLGDKPLGAKLIGTLTTPSLGMPDIQKLATDALQGAATDLIKKEAGKAAGDLLDGVLGGKKGDGKNSLEEQAGGLLKGILGGKKQDSDKPAPDPKKQIEDELKKQAGGLLNGLLGGKKKQ